MNKLSLILIFSFLFICGVNAMDCDVSSFQTEEKGIFSILIEKIKKDDYQAVEDVLVAKIKQLYAQAHKIGIQDASSFVSQELRRFICKTTTDRGECGFPLYFARSQDIVELLLRTGADINQKRIGNSDSLLDKVFEFHIFNEKFRDYLPFFLYHGALLNEGSYRGLLGWSKFEDLLLLLQEGANINRHIEGLSLIEFSNSLLQDVSRRWTEEEKEYFAQIDIFEDFVHEAIFELLNEGASSRMPKLSDCLVNIILRYPELALKNPDDLRDLRYGPEDEYVVDEEEIEAIKKAHEENRQRLIVLTKKELGRDKSLITSLRERELGDR